MNEEREILILGSKGFFSKNVRKHIEGIPGYPYISGLNRRAPLGDLSVNLTNKRDLKGLFELVDVVINGAAHVGSMEYVRAHPADVVNENSLMLLNTYKVISEDMDPNNPPLVINPISNCSYPGFTSVQKESEWWNGRIHETVEPYGMSKKLGFVLSEYYKKQYGIRTINLILPNAYGPEDHLDEKRTHALDGIILRMIKAQKNGDKEFVIWGSGEPIREWIFMPDVGRIIREIIEQKRFDLPNPINIAQNDGYSINEICDIVARELEYDVKFVHDTTKADGDPVKILDDTLFREHFPKFDFTGMDEGIRQTIQYYKKALKIK